MFRPLLNVTWVSLLMLTVAPVWAQVTETRKPILPLGTGAPKINLKSRHIHDQARIFSRESVQDAEQQITALQRQYQHSVTIDTFESVREEKQADVEKMSAAEKNRFYSTWLKERAVGEHAEGLFILITKHPGHVQVGVSSRLHAAGFTEAAKQDILQALIADFKEQQYDRGLMTAIEKAKTRFGQLNTSSSTTSRPAAGPPVPQPVKPAQGWSMGSLLLIAAVVIGGFMLLSRLGRSSTSPGNSGGGPGGSGFGGGGQSGGFFGNMMGGLAGAMAGNWLYNSFSGPSTHAGDQRTYGENSTRDITETSDTWDSSGSDFDDGGGDFGSDGGDFGGGGDDSNSGGGDF